MLHKCKLGNQYKFVVIRYKDRERNGIKKEKERKIEIESERGKERGRENK